LGRLSATPRGLNGRNIPILKLWTPFRSAALDAGAEAFLTNDKKLSKIMEVKILVLKDYLGT